MKYLLSLGLISVGFWLNAVAQDPPPAPDLKTVNVINQEGHVEITWEYPQPSPADGFIAYYADPSMSPDPGIPFDTIYLPDATSIIDVSGKANIEPVPYKIAAFRLIDDRYYTSTQTDYHYTLHLNHSYDTCLSSAAFYWTPYIGGNVLDFYQLDLNDGAYKQVSDTFFTDINLPDNDVLTYSVNAVFTEGISSRSNFIPINTEIPSAPGYINADYVSVNENNELSFRFTLGSGGSTFGYSLVNKTNSDTLTEFPYQNSMEYIYLPGALNESQGFTLVATCGFTTEESNLAKYMYLTGARNGNEVALTWTPYENWLGDVSEYRIIRQTINSTEIFDADLLRLSFNDDIGQLIEEGYDGPITYYIEAIEGNSNPHHIRGISESNRVTILISSDLSFPDAFTPNSDGKNDFFRPMNAGFSPVAYRLIIFNRFGLPVFESTSPEDGWDGKGKRGQPLPEGIYPYYVEYTDNLQQKHSQQGSLVLVLP